MNYKHCKYRCFLLIILAAADFVSMAQPTQSAAKYRHFTTRDGLSNNYVSSLIQDQYGFIWIGTSNGLNRFDGYDFVQYTNRIGDTNSISSNFIKTVFLDSKGFIWVATNNGLNRFDPKTETFKHFRHRDNDTTSIANNQVTSIYEDEAGYLWVGAFQTLDRLDPKTGIFTHYRPPATSITGETLTIEGIIVFEGDVFLSVWGVGVYRFSRKTHRFVPVRIVHKIGREKNWLHHFYIDKKGNLLAADGRFLRFNPKENAFVAIGKDEWGGVYTSVSCIAELSHGKYLAGTTGSGFNSYNSGLELEGSQVLDRDTSIRANNSLQELLTTQSGEVWFGMAGNGLFLWDTNLKKFNGYEHQPNNVNIISAGPVSGVSWSQQGQLWLSSRLAGIGIFDPQKQFFSQVKPQQNGLNTLHVKTIFEDRQGNKWIGTWGGGLNRIDAKTGAFSYFTKGVNSATSLQDDYVTSFCQSPDDRIWVATTRGISVIETKGKQVPGLKSFVYQPGSNKCPAGLRTDALLCDRAGNIWIGTDANGLSRYNPSVDRFDFFQYSFNDINSLGSNKINTLFEDSKHRIWIGCSGGGLNLFVPEKNEFVHYSENDGLPGNEIRGIVEDNRGILWITTDKGLSRFDTKKYSFKNYNVEDGLLSNQFLAQAICKSPADGKIYAGTNNGLVAFYPDSIGNNKFIPPVYINSFKKYRTKDKQTTTEYIRGIQHLTTVELEYNENTFTLSFVSLNYSNSEKNQYAYQLEGRNNNWVMLGTTRELTFSNLPPGNYVLHVKASNSDLVWNEKGSSLIIKILPPWWRTWWACVLYALAVVALSYFFIRQRVKQGIRKLKEQEALRTKISSDLHDEVGSTLSGLAMQSQMMTYTAPAGQKEALTEISNMSREAMDQMRDIVWAMDSRKDKLENLVDRMRAFAEKCLGLKNMTHDFMIENIDAKRFINAEKRQAIYLVFKEAITNIIKHSDAGHVFIKFAFVKSGLYLLIHDNGSRKQAINSDGLGLSNMKMRAEKIGGKLTTGYDNGFVVELTVG
ncbi:MAG: two-component regulator propeller domain-containing protein [Bacteroidota bacterium]